MGCLPEAIAIKLKNVRTLRTTASQGPGLKALGYGSGLLNSGFKVYGAHRILSLELQKRRSLQPVEALFPKPLNPATWEMYAANPRCKMPTRGAKTLTTSSDALVTSFHDPKP